RRSRHVDLRDRTQKAVGLPCVVYCCYAERTKCARTVIASDWWERSGAAMGTKVCGEDRRSNDTPLNGFSDLAGLYTRKRLRYSFEPWMPSVSVT
ncbi:MAG: hypothetical protein ACREJ6_11445, partial [Candidatus Methylomirabilis sp.]